MYEVERKADDVNKTACQWRDYPALVVFINRGERDPGLIDEIHVLMRTKSL